MEIRIPKPCLKCPGCGSKIDKFTIEGPENYAALISSCDNCGAETEFDLIFEDDPKLCNCEVCKKLNG